MSSSGFSRPQDYQLSDMLSCPESPPPSYESTVSLPNFQKSTTSLDNSNSEVISKQPVSLFTLATVSTKCLPGLDSLAVTDHLIAKKKPCQEKRNNTFIVENLAGQLILKSEETIDPAERCWHGPTSNYGMTISDPSGKVLFKLQRESTTCGCFAWSMEEMKVLSPKGVLYGTVSQEDSMGRMKFFIEDAEGPIKLVLQGDKLKKGCSKKMDFTITNVISKNRVGKASIKWTNKRIKDFTLDNSFEIEFFQSMDVRLKAAILGAIFFVDFLLYYHIND